MTIEEILFTEEAKRDFLIGLLFLSKANGVVDENEKLFFENAAKSLSLSDESFTKINTYWDIDEIPNLVFPDTKCKLFFIREAIQLCEVDGSYSSEERELVTKFAANIGISCESVKEIERWVEVGMKWKLDGDRLLSLEV